MREQKEKTSSKTAVKIWALRMGLILGLVHLVTVVLGTMGFASDEESLAGSIFNYYGELSGAGHSYGFFAPGVFSEIHAVFDVTDKNGKTFTTQLETGFSHEADVRVGNIIEQVATESETDDDKDGMAYQRTMAASFAGTIFGRYPDAKAVNVRIQRFTAPSMEEYRQGARPDWEPEYEAKFVVQSSKAKKTALN